MKTCTEVSEEMLYPKWIDICRFADRMMRRYPSQSHLNVLEGLRIDSTNNFAYLILESSD